MRLFECSRSNVLSFETQRMKSAMTGNNAPLAICARRISCSGFRLRLANRTPAIMTDCQVQRKTRCFSSGRSWTISVTA